MSVTASRGVVAGLGTLVSNVIAVRCYIPAAAAAAAAAAADQMRLVTTTSSTSTTTNYY